MASVVRCARLPAASCVLTQKTIRLVQDTSEGGLRNARSLRYYRLHRNDTAGTGQGVLQ